MKKVADDAAKLVAADAKALDDKAKAAADAHKAKIAATGRKNAALV